VGGGGWGEEEDFERAVIKKNRTAFKKDRLPRGCEVEVNQNGREGSSRVEKKKGGSGRPSKRPGGYTYESKGRSLNDNGGASTGGRKKRRGGGGGGVWGVLGCRTNTSCHAEHGRTRGNRHFTGCDGGQNRKSSGAGDGRPEEGLVSGPLQASKKKLKNSWRCEQLARIKDLLDRSTSQSSILKHA